MLRAKLQTRKWEKDGVERYSTEIVISDMTMLGGKSDVPQTSDKIVSDVPSTDFQEDDLPF